VLLDMRAYKTLSLFIHCQSADPGHPLKTGDVNPFIRVGSDFTDNFYEYAIPAQVTPPGSYNTNNANDQATVWPTANTLNISLSTLENAKQARDIAMLNNPNITIQIPYTVKDGNNFITIVGNPTISNVQVIMLGVRNPKKTPATASTDDGKPKCAQIWFDELRMTDFSEKGGYAAITRATAKLADLGSLSISGNLKTPGFGSLETKVGDLSRETDEGFDLSANLEMGKFIPQALNVSVPMYIGYSKQIAIPEYNPLQPDILMSNSYTGLTKEQKASLDSIALNTTTRKSINFTNVHKNKGKNSKKNHIYDIENFSATYAYTEQDHSDINTVFNVTKTNHALLTYNYSFKPKNIQPLIKSQFFKKRKYLALIGDFNFYPLPDKLSASADLDREYSAFQLRNTVSGAADIQMPVAVTKTFNVVRTYNLTYPLTKSLRFDYTATNDSRVMEPEGRPISNNADRDSVRQAFLTRQLNTDFKQSINASYDVPINKLPFLDFVTLSAHYTGTYEWMHAPFAADSMGATIQNSNNKQINGQLNMTMFYNKIAFLKKLLNPNPIKAPAAANVMPGKGRGGPLSKNPMAKDTSKRALDSIKKAQATAKADSAKSTFFYVAQYFAYFATSVKNVSFTYSDNTGTLLPGYNDSTRFFGMDDRNRWAPGVPFVFGAQNGDQFLNTAEQHRWLVPISSIYTPYSTIHTQNLSIHATIEPIPDLKIDLTANRTQSLNTSKYVHDSAGQYVTNTPTESGNFSMTYFCLSTAFTGLFKNSNSSPLFTNYLNYRIIISQRVGKQNYNSGGLTPTGYFDGYSGMSQNVVIPAFIAAYSGQDPNHVSTNLFPSIPMPNFSLSYAGLSKIKWVKKHFQSVTLSSAYTSVYSIGGFNYNLLYAQDAAGLPVARDINDDFLPHDQVPTVSLTSQFSPLIKIAVTFKNNVMSNIEIRTGRQTSLNMSDLTIDEVSTSEYIVGAGYKIKNLTLPFKIGGKAIKNDLNIRVDFSLRQNETVVRNTLNESNQITGGASILSIKSQVEYMITQRITTRLYFDKIINTPFISSTYPTSTMDGGLAIRFTLS